MAYRRQYRRLNYPVFGTLPYEVLRWCMYGTGGGVPCSDVGRARAVRNQHPDLARDTPETRSTFHVMVMLGKQCSTFHLTLMHARHRWLGTLQRCPTRGPHHCQSRTLPLEAHDLGDHASSGGWVPCSDAGRAGMAGPLPVRNCLTLMHARHTTPDSEKGSPRVNFPSRQWFSKVQSADIRAFE